MKTTAKIALVGISLLGLAPLARATMVQSVNGSVTNIVFYDDFEHDTVGFQPNNPEVGSWAGGTGLTTVQNAPSPGPAEGSNYLKLQRIGTGSVLISDFGTISAGSGNQVIATFAFYVPSSAGNEALQVSLGPNLDPSFAGLATAPIWIQGETNNLHTYLAGAEIDTGVTFQDDVWQKVTIAYTFQSGGGNDDFFTVAVNGTVSAPINAGGFNNVTDPSLLRYLSFRTGDNNSSYFLDVMPVPEPSTMMLLLVGSVALYRFRWPKRR